MTVVSPLGIVACATIALGVSVVDSTLSGSTGVERAMEGAAMTSTEPVLTDLPEWLFVGAKVGVIEQYSTALVTVERMTATLVIVAGSRGLERFRRKDLYISGINSWSMTRLTSSTNPEFLRRQASLKRQQAVDTTAQLMRQAGSGMKQNDDPIREALAVLTAYLATTVKSFACCEHCSHFDADGLGCMDSNNQHCTPCPEGCLAGSMSAAAVPAHSTT